MTQSIRRRVVEHSFLPILDINRYLLPDAILDFHLVSRWLTIRFAASRPSAELARRLPRNYPQFIHEGLRMLSPNYAAG